MAVSLQDAWFNSLGSAGYSGALEDMLYAWLSNINSRTTASGATHSLSATDFIIHSTYTPTNTQTITLTTAQTLDGRLIIIKDAGGNAAANNITIDTEGSEKVDGANSIAITANYGVARLYSDGTNWFTF